MKRVIFWLLPVVDVFTLPKVLKYYRSIGVTVPKKHAKFGLLERWAGYLPVGFVLGALLGFAGATLIVLVSFGVVGPIELLLMRRGVRPWRFFKRGKKRAIFRVFLLEGYNAIGYYLIGAGLASLLT